MYNKAIQFFKEVRQELAKVAWPNKQELVGSTVVVVILSIILSAFVGVVDFGLSQLSKLFLNL
jgi:preprotein translocase subunit SecE